MNVAKLIIERDALVSARMQGVLEYRDQNGERVVYKSDAEMARALAWAETQIARLSGDGQPHTIYFKTSKGV